jgi:nucleoside-diphosphate-sugar epimerase
VDDVVQAILLSINQTKAYNQIFIVSNDCKFSDMVDTISDALWKAKSNWVVNELLFRNILKLLNKCINFPIGDSHIDVMMRQTYYTNNKIIKILDFSSSDSVLAQLNKYISAVFNVKK